MESSLWSAAAASTSKEIDYGCVSAIAGMLLRRARPSCAAVALNPAVAYAKIPEKDVAASTHAPLR